MKKQRWLIPIVLLTVALMGVACGNDDSPTVGGDTTDNTSDAPSFAAGSTMAAIQAKGKIVVGSKFDQPGLGQKNPLTNQVEGFDVEIAKLIAVGIFGGDASDLGNKIEFIETPTPVRETVIEQGTVDIVVATYTINDARKQRIDFAGPYYLAGQDIMVKKDNTAITGVESLVSGVTVCSVRNSTPAGRIKERAPEATLIEYDTYSQCKDDLLNGNVDAVSTDNSILLGFVAANPNDLKIVGKKFSDEPYGIGLKRGDDAFRTFINDRLEEIYGNGDWKQAFESTLGKLGVPTPATPPAVDRYTSAGPAPAPTTTAAGATTTTAAPATTTTTG
ncbi:MAG: glutamate transport system substrate-binding protein [Actinomycetota bacterium]|jgi:glutamate transport system substrate-binding protein|nr:glutamate transport system substrate-binding protein [Actinomycetota bacterium]